jgi:hypothetical protein
VPQWYGWAKADGDREVYEHLIIHNDSITKPTEQECIDGVIALQTEYDSNQYQRDRATDYPAIADQLDDIFHNGIDGWKATIQLTKDKYPKEVI